MPPNHMSPHKEVYMSQSISVFHIGNNIVNGMKVTAVMNTVGNYYGMLVRARPKVTVEGKCQLLLVFDGCDEECTVRFYQFRKRNH